MTSRRRPAVARRPSAVGCCSPAAPFVAGLLQPRRPLRHRSRMPRRGAPPSVDPAATGAPATGAGAPSHRRRVPAAGRLASALPPRARPDPGWGSASAT
ncbi:hypothetical protein ZWY2020_013230 [Hordeum vulgare]|nr:hypothetical protein ZWY2020_013230 [Hordeum vulgare]